MKLDLIRIESGNDGTFGVLRIDGKAFCTTLELPNRNNTPNNSCIPVGVYACKKVKSPKFGLTFEVTGVKVRSEILFHVGNTIADSKGCILIGTGYGLISSGVRGVVASRQAMDRFLEATKDNDSLSLEIISA